MPHDIERKAAMDALRFVSPTWPGTVIAGKYRVKSILGRGGMGVVVAAEQLALARDVAIKLIRPEAAGEMDAQRLVREARAAASLRSEHAVRILDVDWITEGQPFVVMELLTGRDLADHLEAFGPLSVTHAVGLLLQALEALAEAHQLGIVHRDIKPSNLFLSRTVAGREHVTVLDFGIAKLRHPMAGDAATSQSVWLGTLHYTSPEQLVSAGRADARSDVWSLGVTLHELVSGRRPYRADSVAALIASIERDPPVPLRQDAPELPEALERLIARCLSRDPDQRPRNAAELAQYLAPFRAAAGPGRTGSDPVISELPSRTPRPRGDEDLLAGGRTTATRTLGGSARPPPRLKRLGLVALGAAALVLALWLATPTPAATDSPQAASAPPPTPSLPLAPPVPAAPPGSEPRDAPSIELGLTPTPSTRLRHAPQSSPERPSTRSVPVSGPPSGGASSDQGGVSAAPAPARTGESRKRGPPRPALADAGAARPKHDLERAIETRH